MPKTITLRINDKEYKTLAGHAEAEKRSIANFIEMAALQYAKESDFADVEEMNAILEDEGLMKRIKQGVNDAKAGKGRFVA